MPICVWIPDVKEELQYIFTGALFLHLFGSSQTNIESFVIRLPLVTYDCRNTHIFVGILFINT